jgi:coenzyme F420-reducing hydrogenase gamma subunit
MTTTNTQTNTDEKASVAVHKFSSCDGCQLALLNLGEPLLALTERVNIKHFAEAGPLDEDAEVDIAFVEGSISTEKDIERIHKVRENSHYLVSIGACATAGGIQALRNIYDSDRSWTPSVYAQPDTIDLLEHVSPIADYVKVDVELRGCPINSYQVLTTINALLLGHVPREDHSAVCLECKRQHNICVMVAQGMPCMGPVTHTGCGALCPHHQRDCFACYGPADKININAMAKQLASLGLDDDAVADRLHYINNGAEPFLSSGKALRDKK